MFLYSSGLLFNNKSSL